MFFFVAKNIYQNVFYFSPKRYKISIFRLVRAHIPSLQNFNENGFDPTLLLNNGRLLFIAGQKRVANPPPPPLPVARTSAATLQILYCKCTVRVHSILQLQIEHNEQLVRMGIESIGKFLNECFKFSISLQG